MKIPIEQLTDAQRQVRENIREHSRLVIFGCAGSGKTMLAIDTAKHLAGKDQRVLALCFNPMLANRLRSKFTTELPTLLQEELAGPHAKNPPRGEIFVSDICSFIRYLVRSHGSPGLVLPRLKWVNSQPWAEFDEPTDIDLNLALDYLFQLPARFDAVVVDQGEQFLGDWWPLVEASLTDRQNGSLYVFADDNSSVYDFQPNFHHDMYEAPVRLSTNCRSASEILDVIRKYHLESKNLDGLVHSEGTVREWIYSSPEELYPTLGEAIVSAESVFTQPQDLVVVLAENQPASQSSLRGMIFDSARLQASRQPGRISWQNTVRYYLRQFGFVVSELSNQPLPGGDDLRKIGAFCSTYQHRHSGELKLQSAQLGRRKLVWSMDNYGELRLHWEDGTDNRPSDRDLLEFFRSSSWAAALPKAQCRYRLTTPEDIPAFPDYHTIRLVDVGYFKGFEALAVIFVLHDFFTPYDFLLRQKFYEAFSRPRQLLHIVSPYSLLA